MIQPPTLEHDVMMLERYGVDVSPEGKVERRIVANLIAHLEFHGFKIHSIYDGEELTTVSDCKSAMELLFNLEEASLRFYKTSPADWHGVLLIFGNGNYGLDLISDWNYFNDDRDGFNAAMDAFDPEQYI